VKTVVAVINECSVLTDDQAGAMVAAIAAQLAGDVCPAWRLAPIDVALVPKGGTPPAGAWWLALLDDSDQAGALGYHELTDHGLPLGKSFVRTDMQYGLDPCVTLSHEAIEMVVDPHLTRAVNVDGVQYAVEPCDPCEDDGLSYVRLGQRVSDFVYPSYYHPDGQTPGPYDFQRVCGQVPTMPAGGYLSEDKGRGWVQIYGDEAHRDRGRLDRGFHRRLVRAMPLRERRRSVRYALPA
jgi:hypothetical protein